MNQATSGLWYKGKLQIALYVGGVMGALSDPLNGTLVTVKMDGDKKIRQSTQIDDFGQAKEVRYIPKPTECEIKIDEINLDLMTAALLGHSAAFSQDAALAQSAQIILVQDRWVSLGKFNVSNVAITGKTLGADFSVNPRTGLIKALNSGTAGPQSVTFDVGAVVGDKIIAGKESVIDIAVFLEVENNSNGVGGILEISKISVLPSTVMQFLGAKDFQDIGFKGDIVKLDGQDLFTFKPNLVFS